MEETGRFCFPLAFLWDVLTRNLATFRGYSTLDGRITELSDELIIDILSRVPAETVLSCRAVCSSWNRLTNNADFSKLHLNRADHTPVIFGRVRTYGWFFINDTRFKQVELKGMELLKRTYEPCVYASCNGLLIFGDDGCLNVISNPVTREEVAFSLQPGDKICGFFFHPVLEEYTLLICHKYDTINKYSVYGLSTKDWRRLGTPIPYRLNDTIGVLTCGSLFWTVTDAFYYNDVAINSEKIVMFDLETETFAVKPQPADRYKRQARTGIKLLEIEGRLGCCDVYESSVDVWILEDIERWKWVKRYVIDLKRRKNKVFDTGPYNKHIPMTFVVGIQHGNLLIYRKNVELLWCNLRRNVVKKVKRTGDVEYWGDVHGVQYIRSLVSLEECNILPETPTST